MRSRRHHLALHVLLMKVGPNEEQRILQMMRTVSGIEALSTSALARPAVLAISPLSHWHQRRSRPTSGSWRLPRRATTSRSTSRASSPRLIISCAQVAPCLYDACAVTLVGTEEQPSGRLGNGL